VPDKPLLTFTHGNHIWNFYQNETADLCCRRYASLTSAWSDEAIVIPGFKNEYSLALNNDEKVHLVAQDVNGALCYRCWDGATWSKITFLEPFDLNWKQVSNLMLSAAGSLVHLVYMSQIEDTTVRVHQYSENGHWSQPRRVHTAYEPCTKAAMQIDNTGRLHLISQETYKGSEQLRHYVFQRQDNKWLQHPVIPGTNTGASFDPCLLADRQNNLHLVWLSSDGINFRVRYSRYQPGGWPVSNWLPEQTISSPNVNAYSPVLITGEDCLVAMWQQIDGIYFNTSSNQGTSWGRPEKEGQFKDFMRLNYQMSDKFNQGGLNLVRTFSATSPQLILLAAFVYATKSLNGPTPSRDKSTDSKSLLSMRNPGALLPQNIQLSQSDNRLYPLTFALEDIRLTNQQLINTVKQQQDQVSGMSARLKNNEQYSTNLAQQVNSAQKMMNKMRQNMDALQSESTRQAARQNNELKNMEQQIHQLRAELAATKKLLKTYEKVLDNHVAETASRTKKNTSQSFLHQVLEAFRK